MILENSRSQTQFTRVKLIVVRLSNAIFDPRRVLLLRFLPKYISQLRKFKKLGGIVTNSYPIFSDYAAQAGSATGHYFHQDLLVASFVHNSNPIHHIDIGSRIDGFVAHVAAFRQIEVMDVRDLVETDHTNISFVKADLMNESSVENIHSDSISCLHAIEHFGLGRYGDPLNPDGHINGFNNILKMLDVGGTVYISFPIGLKNELHFNAHRVFEVKDILTWANDVESIRLERFDYVDDAGNLHQNIDIHGTKLEVLFGCGIYTFRKLY